MRRTFIFLLLLLTLQFAAGQDVNTDEKVYASYFQEVASQTKMAFKLWNQDLYAAILLVDPQTRRVIANEADAAGTLKKRNVVFEGFLPDSVNIANTSLEWGGKSWAMVMLPLPDNKYERISLLAHELFHRAQPGLGFIISNTDNSHLDKKDGRVYLRLELEALKKALLSSSKAARTRHLTHAFTFRKYRYLLYPGADTTENLLELNEGLAEFTGLMVSQRSKKQVRKHLVENMNSFLVNPTFVRSFAYQTTTAYGYLLGRQQTGWNKSVSSNSDLTGLFVNAFKIVLPDDVKQATDYNARLYNGKQIIAEEVAREEKTRQMLALYKSKFIERPHFEITFAQMSVSFDPGNLIPLEDKGTVYPNITVTDKWGTLTVENGALMSPNWDKLCITSPIIGKEGKIYGDGWTLNLTADYSLIKDYATGNFKLLEKQKQ